MSSPRGDGGLDFAPWVPVVDANVGVGHPYNRPAPFDNPRQLREQMQRNGVERAVVYHVLGESLDTVHANDLLETCSTFRTPGVIEQLVAEAGAERILFGSDAPLMDPRSQLGKIITADIDEDAKRMILGMNAQRILGL